MQSPIPNTPILEISLMRFLNWDFTITAWGLYVVYLYHPYLVGILFGMPSLHILTISCLIKEGSFTTTLRPNCKRSLNLMCYTRKRNATEVTNIE